MDIIQNNKDWKVTVELSKILGIVAKIPGKEITPIEEDDQEVLHIEDTDVLQGFEVSEVFQGQGLSQL